MNSKIKNLIFKNTTTGFCLEIQWYSIIYLDPEKHLSLNVETSIIYHTTILKDFNKILTFEHYELIQFSFRIYLIKYCRIIYIFIKL